MVDDANGTKPVSGRRRRRWIAAAIAAGVATTVAAGAAFAYAAAAQSAAATESAATAEDTHRLLAIRGAVYARAEAYEVASDARAIADAAGDLLSKEEREQLLVAIEALDAYRVTALPPGGNSAEIDRYRRRFPSLENAVWVALRAAGDAAIDTARDRLNAATLASPESRDSVTDAIDALKHAEPTVGLVAKLLAAAEAVDKSHQDAAAAAGGFPVENGGSSGGSGGGSGTGGTGGSGAGSGDSTPPPPPPPPPPPAYTDADARADVLAHWSATAPTGSCLPINSGEWSPGSWPPRPKTELVAAGGWLGFEAWSTGTRGGVQYYACY
jgi:hypothetical protein